VSLSKTTFFSNIEGVRCVSSLKPGLKHKRVKVALSLKVRSHTTKKMKREKLNGGVHGTRDGGFGVFFILFSERRSGKISLGLIRKSADFNIQ